MNNTPADYERGIKRARAFMAFLSAALVLIGQTMLFTTPAKQETGIPVPFWLSLAGMLFFAASLAIKPPKFLAVYFDRLSLDGAAPWVLAAVTLSLLATLSMILFQRVSRINYGPVITLWFAGITCYVAAFLKDSLPNIHFRAWLKENRNELLLVSGVTLLAFLLRFYNLGSIPRVINGDEGLIGLAAQSTFQGALANPFALFENFGALYLLAINAVIEFFGPTMFSLRFLPAIGGILAIPAVYLLAREIAEKRVALIAATLLAFAHTHIHFSRTAAVAYIYGTWLIPLELYFLLSGLKNRSAWRAAIGGCLLAIHFSIYISAQIAAGVILIYILLSFLLFRGWFKAVGKAVAVFWGGFAIAIIPEAFYISQHMNEFTSRLNADGTFQTGWLEQTMSATGKGTVQILFERVIHAFLSLIYYPAIDFYGSPVPLLTLITAALFLIGLGITLWRFRSPEYLLLNCYFWGFTLAVGIFALPPTADTYRMLVVIPAAVIMAAIAIDQILEAVGVGWSSSRLAYAAITVLLILNISAHNVWVYYGDFAGRCLYADNMVGRFASYLGSVARTVKREDAIFLLSDDIYRYGTHLSADYLSNGRSITNVMDPVDTLEAIPGRVIIASPNRFDELTSWIADHPGGDVNYTYDCRNLIMISYYIPQR